MTGPGLPDALSGTMALLATAPPPLDARAAEAALREHYGLDGRARPLAAERDRNFMVTLPDGTRRVFKVYHEADDAPARAFQHGALVHMERVGVGLPVPRLLRTRTGGEACEITARDRTYHAILITVVPGAPGDLGAAGVALRHDLGRAAAVIGTALAGYDHPAARRVLPWDLMHLARFADVVAAVPDPARRRWLADTLERFVAHVQPRAATLPAQVIHNDLNGSNVFLDGERVCGVIDFGDMVRAPRIADVAVAANYALAEERDVGAAMGDVLEGYDALRPLDEAEVSLFPDLVAARLALRLLIYQWRADLFPENRDYILRHGEAGRRLADAFAATAPGAARHQVLRRWTDGRRSR